MADREADDINDATPSSLSHIIGQRGVVEQVSVALDAAFADSKKMDDALLVGPPGLGKTQVAKVIAAELAVDCHEVLGQAIKNAADLNAVLLAAKDKDVVFIDEAHELPKEQQVALYLAVDQRKIMLQGNRTGRVPQSIPIANFTVLAATTDEYGLLSPLIDRMKLILRFRYYSEEELTELLWQRCRVLAWSVNEEVLQRIAPRSRGTPRLALRLVQACRRLARSEGETVITADHLEKSCQLEQIDALGLGPVDQQYLLLLAEGDCRLNVLASRLGLPARTVAQVVEPFLLRIGLIDKDDAGRRCLTALGREHLLSSRPIGE